MLKCRVEVVEALRHVFAMTRVAGGGIIVRRGRSPNGNVGYARKRSSRNVRTQRFARRSVLKSGIPWSGRPGGNGAISTGIRSATLPFFAAMTFGVLSGLVGRGLLSPYLAAESRALLLVAKVGSDQPRVGRIMLRLLRSSEVTRSEFDTKPHLRKETACLIVQQDCAIAK